MTTSLNREGEFDELLFGTAPALVDIYRGLTAHGKDVTMPTKYPEEFKRDVVAVARTSTNPGL